MWVHPKKVCRSSRLYFPMAVLLLVCAIAGCESTSHKQLYQNLEAGIRLKKPANWKSSYNERNGIIVLVTEAGIWKKESARIEIHGPACHSIPTGFSSASEEVKGTMDRIRKLYNLESVTIVQEPILIKTGDYEVTQATIVIPAAALADDPARNQVGSQDPFQTIALLAITYDGNTVMAYIYEGTSETLNVQAQEIVESIQLTCSTQP